MKVLQFEISCFSNSQVSYAINFHLYYIKKYAAIETPSIRELSKLIVQIRVI